VRCFNPAMDTRRPPRASAQTSLRSLSQLLPSLIRFRTKPYRHRNSFGDSRLDAYHCVMETKPSRPSETHTGRARGRSRTTVPGPGDLRGGTRVGKEQKSLPFKDERSLPKIGAKSLPISCLFCAPTASHAAQVQSTPSNRQAAGRKEVKLELAIQSR
jgi:hypothetical protein